MIPADLLEKMCCPETRQKLALADRSLLDSFNRLIKVGQLRNRSGEVVKEEVEEGLVREDGMFLYPVRHQIPIMLIEESIPLAPGAASPPQPSS